ncbi:MAG: bifunctional folylpolyglutamate synthase/dihydrofolate synthase [Firmicutes bacterium]|nr:bifunctional folylpolyglutamate synthase/dihydrofolate synthase [Bacillota bacterium]
MKMIGQRQRFGSHLGLDRIVRVCEILGNPQKQLKFIHVAGTSGKGSVSSFLTAVLQRSGFKVGLFTSPHLEHYSERFRVNGNTIDLNTLESVLARAEAACKQVEEQHPSLGPVTEFELATAAGFLFFLEAAAEVVVLETGLGGRLDATNVVTPLLSVITTVNLDHQDRLGSTLEEIAREKGGIIKSGVPVISGVKSPAAERVLREIALAEGAPFHSTSGVAWVGLGWSLAGGRLLFPGFGEVGIGLLGDHQLENAATALLALKELRNLGYNLPSAAIYEGMQGVVWPGRLEVLSQEPLRLLDGAHNEEGILALAKSLYQLQSELGIGKFTFLLGMLHNKELKIIDPLLPLAERFIFTEAESGRLAPMDPSILVDYVESQGYQAQACPNLTQALTLAQGDFPLCICGSLYLVGSVKRILRSQSGMI